MKDFEDRGFSFQNYFENLLKIILKLFEHLQDSKKRSRIEKTYRKS